MKKKLQTLLIVFCITIMMSVSTHAQQTVHLNSLQESTATIPSDKTDIPYATTDIPYLDAEGAQQTSADAETITSETSEWHTGWYVVQDSVTISSRVTVTGAVSLILCDGADLTINGGIEVTADRSLNIYAQSTDAKAGKLNIEKTADYAAGIGATRSSEECGNIFIHGGTIHVVGGAYGAAIGGGDMGEGGNIIINNGTITATGGTFGGAGIGGGYAASGGTITINGGTITATGGDGAAGIGGGGGNRSYYGDDGGMIAIHGGTIHSTGGENGAGIGGGNRGNSGRILITDGNITACGGDWSAGIGGGYNGSGQTIQIDNGIVSANGGTFGAGIGGGSFGSGGEILINGGHIAAIGGGNQNGGGAGIGGGGNGGGGQVSIKNGRVDAIAAGTAAGIGNGSGSSDHGSLTVSGGEIFAQGPTAEAISSALIIEQENYIIQIDTGSSSEQLSPMEGSPMIGNYRSSTGLHDPYAHITLSAHIATYVSRQEATCTKEGNIEYWHCAYCDQYFSDATLTQKITKEETIIKAKGHGEVIRKDEALATCVTEGYSGDMICADCGEILEKGHVLLKLDHDYKDGICTICGAKEPVVPRPSTPSDSSQQTTDPQTAGSRTSTVWFIMSLSAAAAVSALFKKAKKSGA